MIIRKVQKDQCECCHRSGMKSQRRENGKVLCANCWSIIAYEYNYERGTRGRILKGVHDD